MFPSAGHSARPQWQAGEPDTNRYPPAEPSSYPPREHGFNGFSSREDVNRPPPQPQDVNRVIYPPPQTETYRYPGREEDSRNHGPLPHPPQVLAPQPPAVLAAQHPTSQIPPPGTATPSQDAPHMTPYGLQGQEANWGRMPTHQMAFSQPAPRQRTAIACRYCRRRKIRCSGFESSQDGRCTNCQRFNQECIFTPVSSQTQAFVPAHTQYPAMRQIPGGRGGPRQGYPQLYGAHGQPLSIQPPGDYPHAGPPPSLGHEYARGPSPGPHQSAPNTHPTHPSPYDPSYHSASPPYADDRGRAVSELHPPILPQPQLTRRSSQGDYPVSWREPNSPPAHGPSPAAPSPGSYGYGETGYLPGLPRHTTPPYQENRPPSISPHPTIHPPMWPGPPRPESAGPPALPPMQLAPRLDQAGGNQRSATDDAMLNQLKKNI